MRYFVWGISALVALAGVFLTSSLHAQTSDSETFCLAVPALVSIAAPTPLVTAAHDQTDANFAFPTQQWVATCSNANGATVTFELEQPFIRTTTPIAKRDAAMTITLDNAGTDPGANWTVIAPITVQTFYEFLIPIESVTIAAASTNAGTATFNVDVEFVTVDYSAIPEGKYETTVTGTITAN